MRLRERLRLSRQPDETSPWWSIVLVALGAGLIGGGLWLGGTWADVAIEVGAAAGVGGIVLWFKPRLMRQVDQVATQAAAAVTDKFTEQFVKLENIGELQANEVERQRSETKRIVTSIEEAVTFANVEAMLMHAYHQGFFRERLMVKTNTERGKPLLEISPFSVNREDQLMPMGPQVHFRVLSYVSSYNNRVELGPIDDGTTIWQDGEDLQQIVGRIIGIYKRSRLPENELDFNLVFSHMIESFHLMTGTLQDPRQSTRTPRGKLALLINQEWALTDIGLEGITSDNIFTPGRKDGRWVAIDVSETPCPPDCDNDLWNEAKAYMDSMKVIITGIATR